MSIVGPRLDRPSAIGDEGRPRATSLTISSLLVVATFLITSLLTGRLGLALAVATLGSLVAAGVGLQQRVRLRERFVANLCLLGAGSLLTFVSISLLRDPAGIVVVGFALAMLAMALTWANVATADGFSDALRATVLSFGATIAWVIGAVMAVFSLVFLWAVLTDDSLAREPVLALIVFALSVAGAGVAVGAALDHLPIVQLRPRSRRERTVERVERARWLAHQFAKAGVALLVLVAVGMVLLGMMLETREIPFGEPIAAVFGSPFVLGLPALVAVLAVGATILSVAIRTVTARLETRTEDLLPAVAAGLAFLLFIPAAVAGIPWLLLLDSGAVVGLLIAGPLALIVALAIVIGGMGTDVIPDRAGGPAIAAGSLLIATVGAGLLELPTPLVLATAASALIVWDVSTFGLGLTAELGHRPETRRLELFHGVLAVGVGAVAVVFLVVVEFARQNVRLGGQARLAAAVAVAAVLVAAVVLRR